jgi:maleamate amidohydrolase
MTDLESNYSATGFNNRLGFGTTPALILIDLAQAYFLEGSPLYHPRFASALDSCVRMRVAARKAGVPVILTRVELRKGGLDGGVFFEKSRIPMLCFEEGNPLAEFAPSVAVEPDDIILTKRYPSPFFATYLASMLTAMKVDTLLIGGVSTSGCVRATALDACQSGFRPMVISDACGDRHPGPHDANLFDINAKYGDVISEGEAATYMQSVDATT